MNNVVATNETILVVGGGISGITAALEAVECGKSVVLVEKSPTLGGRVAQLYRYFPKLCRPSCGLEINLQRIRGNRNLRVITMATLTKLHGQAGDYTAELAIAPRYVNEKCTACGACAEAITATVDDPPHKAAYLPHHQAYPYRYVIDPSIVGGAEGKKARAACPADAIDLDMQPQSLELRCGAVIIATGWRPYDAAKIQPYGYGRFPDVITSVELERMMDRFGPTAGQLVRPSTGEPAKRVAFIQCAGSRDANHLPYCSRICCMVSLKQSTYLAEQYGDAQDVQATIYYIDIRTIDRFEDFEQRVRQDPRVQFVKSKVAQVSQDASGTLLVHGVDTHGYRRYDDSYDLVVLAIGMQPATDLASVMATSHRVAIDDSGFIVPRVNGGDNGNNGDDKNHDGVFAAGCAANPLDVNRSVQSATAAALRAIQVVNRVARVTTATTATAPAVLVAPT